MMNRIVPPSPSTSHAFRAISLKELVNFLVRIQDFKHKIVVKNHIGFPKLPNVAKYNKIVTLFFQIQTTIC